MYIASSIHGTAIKEKIPAALSERSYSSIHVYIS
jgi:hypothetical protein